MSGVTERHLREERNKHSQDFWTGCTSHFRIEARAQAQAQARVDHKGSHSQSLPCHARYIVKFRDGCTVRRQMSQQMGWCISQDYDRKDCALRMAMVSQSSGQNRKPGFFIRVISKVPTPTQSNIIRCFNRLTPLKFDAIIKS